MKSEFEELLGIAPIDRLKEIIRGVYGIDSAVDSCIESQLLRENPVALAKQLKKRIQSLKRGSRFISYGESFDFSKSLNALVRDIELLLSSSPQLAFVAADDFMATHQKVFERVDDSGGAVGDSYRQGLHLWLQAASRWREQQADNARTEWPTELYTRHLNNPYGMWDTLIQQSTSLLSEEELRQLAWRFEGESRRALKDDLEEPYNRKLMTASLGMAAVAQALKDVELYERSYLLRSPQPNELQKQSIIEFCLAVGDGEAALRWLDGEWHSRFEADRLRLLDATLAMLGRHDELIDLRRAVYDVTPGFENLQALLQVLPEQEKAQVQHAAVSRALQTSDLEISIATLIALGASDQAAQEVLDHADKLTKVFYGTLSQWASSFANSEHYLAAVICYRVLLEDILNAGRSTAYGHAVRYYKRLAELGTKIPNYHALMNGDDYVSELRRVHGRKASFWREI
ncbi:MAG: hypothetical protein Q8L60_14275 [Gammaproteobacteria bacterium]|nr:hypothetical protein [Gammaproteobacteria bacterium]MDP2346537.1 hypothetical protein [Gammaproteobacteria bacterium]